MTCCTANRVQRAESPLLKGLFSRYRSRGGPLYQGVCGDPVTTLSPLSAETGTVVRLARPSVSANVRNSVEMTVNTSADQSTRSILLTHNTMCGTRSSEHR